MAAMHEEMHANTEGKQRDQNPISREDVDAMLVDQQQARNRKEDGQGYAGT
jgi:hypothetical protein